MMAKNKNAKGSWVDDPFLSYAKGHTRYEETDRDGMQFTLELRGLEALFPSTHDPSQDFFINHPGSRIQRELNEHFLTRQRSYERIYGNMFDIAMFFGSALKESAKYGEVYFSLNWTEPVGARGLILVDNFSYLRDSTMHTKRSISGRVKGYRQKYSRLVFMGNPYARPQVKRVTNFSPNEVLHITYPFEVAPVKASLGLLKKSQAWWKFSLDYARSGDRQKDMPLGAERARYKSYSAENRDFLLARAKIGKNFHQFDAIRELPRTDYYDAYILCRYMKDKIHARQYMIDQFNEQVLIPLAKKNNIKRPPVLEQVGLTTEAEVDDLMDAVDKNIINHSEFIELFNTFK